MFAYPGEMSGGEQRRVVIARALINKPRLLLAYEPTSDLDEDTENDIIVLLEELRREAAFGMIVVTHNLELAKRADRMFEMKDGVLTAADLPEGAFHPVRPERRFGHTKLTVPANIVQVRRSAAALDLDASALSGGVGDGEKPCNKVRLLNIKPAKCLASGPFGGTCRSVRQPPKFRHRVKAPLNSPRLVTSSNGGPVS